MLILYISHSGIIWKCSQTAHPISSEILCTCKPNSTMGLTIYWCVFQKALHSLKEKEGVRGLQGLLVCFEGQSYPQTVMNGHRIQIKLNSLAPNHNLQIISLVFDSCDILCPYTLEPSEEKVKKKLSLNRENKKPHKEPQRRDPSSQDGQMCNKCH